MILYYLQQLGVYNEEKCTERNLGLEVPMFSSRNFIFLKVNFVDGKTIYLGHFTFTNFAQNAVLCVVFFV